MNLHKHSDITQCSQVPNSIRTSTGIHTDVHALLSFSQLQVGTNFEFLVGQLEYVDDDDNDDTRLATIVGVCIGVFAVIFIIIACVIYKRRRRSRKQTRHRNHYKEFGSEQQPGDDTLTRRSGDAKKKIKRNTTEPVVSSKNTDAVNVLQSAELPTVRQEMEEH